jgi:hypothetical protein
VVQQEQQQEQLEELPLELVVILGAFQLVLEGLVLG